MTDQIEPNYLDETQWDEVFNQIREDVLASDWQAIYEMLDQLPPRVLLGYVKEDDQRSPLTLEEALDALTFALAQCEEYSEHEWVFGDRSHGYKIKDMMERVAITRRTT